MTLDTANQKRTALMELLDMQDTDYDGFLQRIDELVPLALDAHDALVSEGRLYTAFGVLLLAVHPDLSWSDKVALSEALAEIVEQHDQRYYFDGRIHSMRKRQQFADFIMGSGDE